MFSDLNVAAKNAHGIATQIVGFQGQIENLKSGETLIV